MNDDAHEEFAEFQAWMNRHLISLVLIYWHLNESGDRCGVARVAACSGTVMSIGEMWFLLTAGHVLQELDALVTHERVEIAETFIVDSLGSQAQHLNNIPFNYPDAARHYVFEDGLDYGLICLNANIRRLMESNGILPVGIANWINQDVNRCKGFVLLGIPAELVDARAEPPAIKIGSIIASVRRLQDLPAGAEHTRYERFIGELTPTVDLQSLEGVSGGPIIGFFDEDGAMKYWVVALQSMSVGTRYILGCPMKLFGDIILDEVRRMVDD